MDEDLEADCLGIICFANQQLRTQSRLVRTNSTSAMFVLPSESYGDVTRSKCDILGDSRSVKQEV